MSFFRGLLTLEREAKALHGRLDECEANLRRAGSGEVREAADHLQDALADMRSLLENIASARKLEKAGRRSEGET